MSHVRGAYPDGPIPTDDEGFHMQFSMDILNDVGLPGVVDEMMRLGNLGYFNEAEAICDSLEAFSDIFAVAVERMRFWLIQGDFDALAGALNSVDLEKLTPVQQDIMCRLKLITVVEGGSFGGEGRTRLPQHDKCTFDNSATEHIIARHAFDEKMKEHIKTRNVSDLSIVKQFSSLIDNRGSKDEVPPEEVSDERPAADPHQVVLLRTLLQLMHATLCLHDYNLLCKKSNSTLSIMHSFVPKAVRDGLARATRRLIDNGQYWAADVALALLCHFELYQDLGYGTLKGSVGHVESIADVIVKTPIFTQPNRLGGLSLAQTICEHIIAILVVDKFIIRPKEAQERTAAILTKLVRFQNGFIRGSQMSSPRCFIRQNLLRVPERFELIWLSLWHLRHPKQFPDKAELVGIASANGDLRMVKLVEESIRNDEQRDRAARAEEKKAEHRTTDSSISKTNISHSGYSNYAK